MPYPKISKKMIVGQINWKNYKKMNLWTYENMVKF